MQNSPHWSNASAACRIDWRPSRVCILALMALALLAPLSLFATDLPPAPTWLGAALACACGLRSARAYARLPRCSLRIVPGATAQCDGEPMDALRVQWRGPLAFMAWRDRQGRVQRRVWWPDVLDAARRRELRLAMQRCETAPRAASVAG